jgi:excisionase family DNA binding protein
MENAMSEMTEGCRDTPAKDLIFGAADIARYLGRNRDQIYYAIRSGSLPTFKLGGQVCARKSTLLTWIEGREDERPPTRS